MCRGIENHVFIELTQHHHLEHCLHHHPVASLVWRLILMLAFDLFEDSPVGAASGGFTLR